MFASAPVKSGSRHEEFRADSQAALFDRSGDRIDGSISSETICSSDAIFEFDTKSDAALASVMGNGGSDNPIKNAPPSVLRADGAFEVGAEGLEPPTLSV